GSLAEAFPLLSPIAPGVEGAPQRLSVTQLINYQRCPRQYYFDRVLRVAGADELAVWNNAEAPEPPANLNATLKGAVIHRFCETYLPGEALEERLRQSFSDVIRGRQAQLADRLSDINEVEALKELAPLAQNYLASGVFERAERVRKISGVDAASLPTASSGLWSELSFRLRRPWGMLTGTIDKLLISPAGDGEGFEIELIDFKTNRIDRESEARAGAGADSSSTLPLPSAPVPATVSAPARHHRSNPDQFAFEFSEPESKAPIAVVEPALDIAASLNDQVRIVASDYQLQMQAYALAVHELLPELVKRGTVRATLHFLHPNVEWTLTDEMLQPEVCAAAIDEAMLRIINSCGAEDFPVRPARHCGMCSFLRICYAGRQELATVQSPRSRRKA
ncbi:MAG TPA: PD-(D/E)XK nuclease family protein, partial [Pyrinomonadaceae bacterium]|nr:PD-(D/E)XK nuclease family protein [Pyrinomonadaceae bacterium]